MADAGIERQYMQCKLAFLYSIVLLCLLLGSCVGPGDPSEEPVYPRLQPSSGKIAFASTRDNGFGTIYVVNSDGSSLTRVAPPDLHASFPRWRPGCDMIAFSTEDGIYTVSTDGSGLHRLIELSQFALVSWSPSGSQIAFSVLDESLPRGANIWTMNADGTGKRKLTDCSISCGEPMWHAKEDVIYYFSDENDYRTRPRRKTLNRVDVNGTKHEIWLSASETADIPFRGMRSISPNGTSFVLITEFGEEGQYSSIYVLDIESKEWRRLTDDQAYYDHPGWSPDGKQIVFVRYVAPSPQAMRVFPSVSELWIMSADGRARVQLVDSEGKNTEPDWCAP
jgi:Tol biopolymer transport system component